MDARRPIRLRLGRTLHARGKTRHVPGNVDHPEVRILRGCAEIVLQLVRERLGLGQRAIRALRDAAADRGFDRWDVAGFEVGLAKASQRTVDDLRLLPISQRGVAAGECAERDEQKSKCVTRPTNHRGHAVSPGPRPELCNWRTVYPDG